MTPQTVTNADKRKEHRQRTLKAGRIVFNGGYGVFDCTVRNVSPHGAMLIFGTVVGIPTHFDLELDGGRERHPCTVRWRTDRSVGVSFDDAP